MAINPTIASPDNGVKSMADILGDDAHLLDGQPSIDTSAVVELEDTPENPVQFPTEGEQPTRDDQGRFTKADEDVPGILKDEEKQEDDLPGDDELDDLLKGLPDDEVSRARKGVQKVVNRAKEREQAAQAALSWEAALLNPETAAEALEQLSEMVQKRVLGQEPQKVQPEQQQPVQPASNEDAQLANETWAETKERWRQEFVESAKAEMRKELGTELAPIKGFVNEAVTDRQLNAKVTESMPSLMAEFPKHLVTAESVRRAIETYPTLPPMDAFAAVHRKALAKHFATPLPQPKHQMVSQNALASREIQRQPGAYVSMDEIFAEQGVME